MTTSGTTVFNMDVLDLTEEAWERASGGTTELRSGYNLRTARRSLNLLLLEWANRGLNLWTVDAGEISIVAGTTDYPLPADTVDLIEHRVRLATNTPQMDRILARVNINTYVALSGHVSTGAPTQIYVDRQVAAPIARLWPVPNMNGAVLMYWRLRRIQDSGAGDATPDVPFRFLPVLVAGLAYYIAGKIVEGAPRLPMLKAQYDEAWQMASDEDRDKAPIRLVPFVGRL